MLKNSTYAYRAAQVEKKTRGTLHIYLFLHLTFARTIVIVKWLCSLFKKEKEFDKLSLLIVKAR